MVYKIIRRTIASHDDAMDIAQNVFINIYKYLPKFKGESQISTWIYRITVNEILKFLKMQSHYIDSSIEVSMLKVDTLPQGRILSESEVEKIIEEAKQTLPPKQRIVFDLRYYEEMSYEEMSEVLNTSDGALKASYHHAVKKIKEFIQSYD